MNKLQMPVMFKSHAEFSDFSDFHNVEGDESTPSTAASIVTNNGEVRYV